MTACDVGHHVFPPKPTEPLVRQMATGADACHVHEMVWPDNTPPFYNRIKLADPSANLTMDLVLKSMLICLPQSVHPCVVLTPRSDSCGTTFTIVLTDISRHKPQATLAEFGISEAIAWEYIACDFLRRCYLGCSPIKLATSALEHFNTFLNSMLHFASLHDSLGEAIFGLRDGRATAT
jgi:hypothetical protein